MNVGDIVALTWLDSGLRIPGSSIEEARDTPLHHVTSYGEVVARDEVSVLLAHDIGPDGAGDFGRVALSCVTHVDVLRQAQTVEEIIAEVEAEAESADHPMSDPWVAADRKARASTRKTARYGKASGCQCQGCLNDEKWCIKKG